jgi:hypothetical protein
MGNCGSGTAYDTAHDATGNTAYDAARDAALHTERMTKIPAIFSAEVHLDSGFENFVRDVFRPGQSVVAQGLFYPILLLGVRWLRNLIVGTLAHHGVAGSEGRRRRRSEAQI